MKNSFVSFLLTLSFIVSPFLYSPAVNAQSNSGIGQVVTTCQFIDFLINIGAIIPEKVNAARSLFSCVASNWAPANNSVASSTVASTTAAATSSISVQPTVDLWVNGSRGGIQVASGSFAIVSWVSTNAEYCYSGGVNRATSGFYEMQVSAANSGGSFLVVSMSCAGAYGTSTDELILSVSQAAGSSSSASVFSSGAMISPSSAPSALLSGLSSSSTLSYLSTSTATTTVTTSATTTDDKATDLDHVMILSEGLNCVSAASNFLYQAQSYSKGKPVKYVWDKKESQLIDNMAGAFVGNIMGHEGDREDATFTAPYANLERGMVLYLVIGEKAKCTLYGDEKMILRAYITAQGKDWVKEQEKETAGGTDGEGSF